MIIDDNTLYIKKVTEKKRYSSTVVLVHGSQDVHSDQALILQSIDAGSLICRTSRLGPCL